MKSRINTIVACVLLLGGTYAYCESANGENRASYEKLNNDGCDLCEKKGEKIEARAKWEEVARWADSRTNDVLRYKSVGNLLLLDLDCLDKCNRVKRGTYDLMMCRVCTLEQITKANISEREWGPTDPKALLKLAKEARGTLSNVQIDPDPEPGHQGNTNNPYEMPITQGMLRGLGTAIMSPLDISLTFHIADKILDATYSDNARYNSAAQRAEDEGLLGLLRLTVSLTGGIIGAGCYIVKDAGVGLADFCTLGWVGNCLYDEETSPWWWQRFGGKTKAKMFR